jgi:paraquat-inducible protein B
MKTKASPTLIGVFTLVGLAIASAAIILLGADKFFRKTHNIQLYFDKSAQGLQVGSDVRFGGVRVGSVQSISVLIDPNESRKIIPVVVSLNAGDLGKTGVEAEGGIDFSTDEGIQKAVQRGLRAGMKQQSLVTGQLYIEFDVLPESVGFVYTPMEKSDYPVVPTVGTEMDELIAGIADGIRKFNALDLDSVITELRGLLQNTSARIEAIDAEGISENLLTITKDISSITGDDRITLAIENLNETLANLESLTRKADDGISPLIDEAGRVLAASREVIETSRDSLTKLESAVDGVTDISNPRGPVLMRLQQTLHETERASRALKELFNDLKRDPKSILTGKAESE